MINKTCLHCATEFVVPNWRQSAKFCCRACSDAHPRSEKNATCTVCGSMFHIKPSKLNRTGKVLGTFCTARCAAEAKKLAYSGNGNPNYKGRNVDSSGYRLLPPSAIRTLGHTVKRLHQAVACEALGVSKIPAGFHVHHRDCDVTNNTPENLAVLSVSDHKWLHKQFGVATLWAFCRGDIDLDSLVSWSDDHDRARNLLPTNVLIQAAANDNGFSGT